MAPPSIPQPRKRFALDGRSRAVDPLRQAVRRDLADVREAENVFAPHYAAPVPRRVRARTPLREGRDPDSTVIASLEDGERFDLLDVTGATAWGIALEQELVGYCEVAALGPAE